MAKKGQAEFTKWFGPLLDALRELGDSGKPREVTETIARKLNIPDKILDETTKTGVPKFHNQVAWARQYLVWEGLLDSSKYGTWKLTAQGKETNINNEEARRIFLKWVDIHQKARKEKLQKEDDKELEELKSGELGESTTTDLLSVLQDLTPSGFEKVCKELLRESGFENVIVTGQSHDGGIDGYGTLEINPFVSFK
ncbi:winged helix-turn-helix domain-containing protein, partial [Bacteroidota bacterium]